MRNRFHSALKRQLIVMAMLFSASFVSLADTNFSSSNSLPASPQFQSTSNSQATNLQTGLIPSTEPTTQAPLSVNIHSNPSPTSPKEQVASHDSSDQHSYSDLFINWTVAIFAILAVAFALFVLLLAVRGWSEYSKFFEKINSDIESKLNTEIGKKSSDFFEKTVQPQLNSLFSQKHVETVQLLNTTIANELDKARIKLDDEIKRLMKDDDISRQVVELAVTEVGRRLSPPSPASKPDEFEPNGGKK